MNTTDTIDAHRGHTRARWAGAARLRPGMGLGLLVLASLPLVLAPVPARASDEINEITWAHPTPGQVRNFVLYVSPVEGSVQSARQIDLGKPPGESSGFLSIFTAMVPLEAADFVAVGAVGFDGRLSGLSAWSQPAPSRPGQPVVVEP
jgi:hypothetical protein